jgi:hypothetical protein
MENKHEWLFDDISKIKEKIRFKDRIEYRVKGKIHNSVGPAIIFFETEDEEEKRHFYIKGDEYTFEDWNLKMRPVKLKKLQNKIKNKK